MPSTARTIARATARDPGALALVLLGVAVEGVLRTAVGLVDPFAPLLVPPVLALLVPPFAIAALGSVAYVAVRDHVGVFAAAATLRRWRSRLAVAVVAGHALALALGTALFLLLDTAIRAALYALGHGDWLAFPVQALAPLLGLGACTYAAYALLVPGIDRVLNGGTVRDAAVAVAGAPFAAPFGTLGAVGAHLLVGVGAGAIAALGLGPALFAWSVPGVAFYALLGTLTLGLVGIGTWVLLVYHAGIGGAPAALAVGVPGRRRWRGAVLAALVVTGLVAGAVAVRATETRPGGDAAEPLPADPDGAYATAIANTAETSHQFRSRLDAADESYTFRYALDHEHRRMLVTRNGAPSGRRPYESAGTSMAVRRTPDAIVLAGWHAGENRSLTGLMAASPGYWLSTAEPALTGFGGLPAPERVDAAGGWTVVDESDGQRTLELTGRAACRGLNYFCRDEEATLHDAVVHVTIDYERGVVTGGAATIDATSGGERKRIRREWDVETGATVERPADVGDPRPSELVWKVFAY